MMISILEYLHTIPGIGMEDNYQNVGFIIKVVNINKILS